MSYGIYTLLEWRISYSFHIRPTYIYIVKASNVRIKGVFLSSTECVQGTLYPETMPLMHERHMPSAKQLV